VIDYQHFKFLALNLFNHPFIKMCNTHSGIFTKVKTKVMNTFITKRITFSIMALFIGSVAMAQQYTSQTVTFGVSSHALVGVNTNTLAFSFASPNAAGNGLVAQSAQASTNLYYSFMPSSPVNGATNGAKIKVNFTGIPSGMSISLQVDDNLITNLSPTIHGDLGNVVGGFSTGASLGSGATDIINGIGASYTGTNYYVLTYEASISDYSDLSSNPTGATPTIQYTITQ